MIPMFCTRCDQPIRPGEPYGTHLHHGATFAGCTTHSHHTCPGPHRSSPTPDAPALGDPQATPPSANS